MRIVHGLIATAGMLNVAHSATVYEQVTAAWKPLFDALSAGNDPHPNNPDNPNWLACRGSDDDPCNCDNLTNGDGGQFTCINGAKPRKIYFNNNNFIGANNIFPDDEVNAFLVAIRDIVPTGSSRLIEFEILGDEDTIKGQGPGGCVWVPACNSLDNMNCNFGSSRPLCASEPSPTGSPTVATTDAPTVAATDAPTVAATDAPTVAATDAPTVAATDAPTVAATDAPTVAATDAPTVAATDAPTVATTDAPTVGTTDAPTVATTDAPTVAATDAPTVAATDAPTVATTDSPTVAATDAPTVAATDAPAVATTDAPTVATTDAPTSAPTELPTTSGPTSSTPEPTGSPTTSAPAGSPTTSAPAGSPTTSAPTDSLTTSAPTSDGDRDGTEGPPTSELARTNSASTATISVVSIVASAFIAFN